MLKRRAPRSAVSLVAEHLQQTPEATCGTIGQADTQSESSSRGYAAPWANREWHPPRLSDRRDRPTVSFNFACPQGQALTPSAPSLPSVLKSNYAPRASTRLPLVDTRNAAASKIAHLIRASKKPKIALRHSLMTLSSTVQMTVQMAVRMCTKKCRRFCRSTGGTPPPANRNSPENQHAKAHENKAKIGRPVAVTRSPIGGMAVPLGRVRPWS